MSFDIFDSFSHFIGFEKPRLLPHLLKEAFEEYVPIKENALILVDDEPHEELQYLQSTISCMCGFVIQTLVIAASLNSIKRGPACYNTKEFKTQDEIISSLVAPDFVISVDLAKTFKK